MHTFESKDLSLMAALYASGMQLEDVRNDHGVVFFAFRDAERCKKLTRSYFRSELVVDAKRYAEALRTLKDLIFQGYGAARR